MKNKNCEVRRSGRLFTVDRLQWQQRSLRLLYTNKQNDCKGRLKGPRKQIFWGYLRNTTNKVEANFTLEEATKTQSRSRGVALLFL